MQDTLFAPSGATVENVTKLIQDGAARSGIDLLTAPTRHAQPCEHGGGAAGFGALPAPPVVVHNLTSREGGTVEEGPAKPSAEAAGLAGGPRRGVPSADWITECLKRYTQRREYLAECSGPLDWAARRASAARLAGRAVAHDTGLSNTAYLAATSGTQKLTLTLTPARAKLTFSDPLTLPPLSGPVAGGGLRGAITEFSASARDRLADRSAELQQLGHKPQLMITLTAPANYEQIYIYDENGEVLKGGRIFKLHLNTFRKRLTRKLKVLGINDFSALWFLEFQERGAPHIHIILFNCVISTETRLKLREWCGDAWADIVGNPSEFERAKHARAGTQVAKMRKGHFGYALKYASKMEQKLVPDGFLNVGRFWGVWNCSKGSPIVLEFDYLRLNKDDKAFIYNLAGKVLETIREYSENFFFSRATTVMETVENGIKYKRSFSVFGPAAVAAALAVIS